VSFVDRIREIVGAIRDAKFPSPPNRKYDLIGQQLAGSGGRGRIRSGGEMRRSEEERTSDAGPDRTAAQREVTDTEDPGTTPS
jgi:hypothetical protein